VSIVDRFFDPQFLGALLAGLAVFATVLTLAAPLLKGDRLAGRLKAVSEHRDALRRRQMEELNKKANIRGQQVDFMKRAVDQLKLQNLLETPGIREKLSAAGYRGQGPVYAFLFFRFAMPLLLMAVVWKACN
jgi:tight adherence protein C